MNRATRSLWLAVVVLASSGIGAVTALLAWLDSHALYDAVIAGGSATGGSFLILLAGIHFATGSRESSS